MFEYPSFYDASISTILGCEKALLDGGREMVGVSFEDECFWESYAFALDRCADSHYSTFEEEYESEVNYFMDHGIVNYVKLAHEYGKRHHLRQKDNPWFKKIDHSVRSHMIMINSYSYDWDYVLKRTNKKPICFIFYTGPEFYSYSDAIEAIIGVIDFFRDGAEELNKILREEKIIKLPTQQERRAA